jgi:hypothetical protein
MYRDENGILTVKTTIKNSWNYDEDEDCLYELTPE